MKIFIFFAPLLAAQVSEACNRDTGVGCAIESPSDEVSLIQTKQKVEERGGKCEWTGKGTLPAAKFICAGCPKVRTVAHAAGFQVQVKRDPNALFMEKGKCHERAVMTVPGSGSSGMQYECVRDEDFAGPCTKKNEHACVCHLGIEGKGMTFESMVDGFKDTLREAVTEDEGQKGGDFSHSEAEGEVCNWDGREDTPTDKFICSQCPKVQKVLKAKGDLKGKGTTYTIQYPKTAKTLFSSGTECFERAEMVDSNHPDSVPTSFQCRRNIMESGPCTEENQDKLCACALGKDGSGATFKDLAEGLQHLGTP